MVRSVLSVKPILSPALYALNDDMIIKLVLVVIFSLMPGFETAQTAHILGHAVDVITNIR